MRHYLKTWPQYFGAVKCGVKPFEVRLNDRNYQTGDTLLLQEYDPHAAAYTGNTLTCDITFLLSGGQFGIEQGYVAMGLRVTSSRTANAEAHASATKETIA